MNIRDIQIFIVELDGSFFIDLKINDKFTVFYPVKDRNDISLYPNGHIIVEKNVDRSYKKEIKDTKQKDKIVKIFKEKVNKGEIVTGANFISDETIPKIVIETINNIRSDINLLKLI